MIDTELLARVLIEEEHPPIPGPGGKAGRDGIDGRTGAAGKAGQNGIDGQNGAPGKAGEQGPTGPVGPKGDKGDPGEPGTQGPMGPQGIRGMFPRSAGLKVGTGIIGELVFSGATVEVSNGKATVTIAAGPGGGVATFVEPTTATPEQICLALIAAGLMAAS